MARCATRFTALVIATVLLSGCSPMTRSRQPESGELDVLQAMAQKEFDSRDWLGLLDWPNDINFSTTRVEAVRYEQALPLGFSASEGLFEQVVDDHFRAQTSIVASDGAQLARIEFQYVDGSWSWSGTGSAGERDSARALLERHFGSADIECREVNGPHGKMLLGRSGTAYAAVWYMDEKLLMEQNPVDPEGRPDSMVVYSGDRLGQLLSNTDGTRDVDEYWRR